MLDPLAEFKEHRWPYDYDHRGAEEGGRRYFGGGKPFGFFATTSGGWELDGEPYTVADGTDDFWWFRSRIVGGRTNHYGRISLRFSDYDFNPRDRDGLGWNWPIAYEDPRALVRPGRGVHRRRRQPRGDPERARRRLSRSPAAQGARAAHPARQPEDGHPLHPQPAGGHHPRHQRPARLPLLRAVRPRLPDRLELLGEPDADLPGARDRPAPGSRPGHGAGDHDGRQRKGGRRRLCRQADGPGTAGALPHAGPGRERLRVGSSAPELARPPSIPTASATRPAWWAAT